MIVFIIFTGKGPTDSLLYLQVRALMIVFIIFTGKGP